MKHIFKLTALFLLTLFMSVMTSQDVQACNYSDLTLDSVEADTGGTYLVWMTFCVGGGRTAGDVGADGETEQFWFEIYPKTAADTIVDQYSVGYSFPETLCSGQEVGVSCPRCNCAIGKKGLIGYFYRFSVCSNFLNGCPRHTVSPVACPGGAGTCIDYTANHSIANGFGYDTSIPLVPAGFCSGCPGPTLGTSYKVYTDVTLGTGKDTAYCDTMYIRTNSIPDSLRVWDIETKGAVSTPGSKNGNCELNTDLLIDLSTLNVTIDNFTGTSEENVISLNWETSLEPDNDFFMIQKSIDGIIYRDFNRIDGVSKTNRLNNYSIFDPNPVNGYNFYRLVQYDKDGSRNELSEVTVFYKGNIKSHINYISPVPAADMATISIYSGEAQRVTLDVMDLHGKKMFSKELMLEGGETKYEVDLNNFNQGLYIVKIRNNKLNLTGKILKQR